MKPADSPAPPAAKPGSDDLGSREAPTGDGAVDLLSQSSDVSGEAQANALAYFMGDEPPPGRESRIQRRLDFGTPDRSNFQLCVFRTLAAEEFDKCEELAQVKDAAGVLQRIDTFKRWSYVFAYSCVDPNLGQALSGRRQRLEGKAEQGDEAAQRELERLSDTAALVREVFRFQPGVLQRTVFEVEKYSRMTDNDRTVLEVDAGKTLS